MSYVIAIDDLYPRDEAHRWRIYVRRGAELDVVAATDSPAGIGEALVHLDLDEREIGQRLSDRGAVGVLDAVERTWLVSPWHRSDAFQPPAPASSWTGRIVASKHGNGQTWRVGELGPLGFHLAPVDPLSDLCRPMSRTEEQLDRNFVIVNPKENR